MVLKNYYIYNLGAKTGNQFTKVFFMLIETQTNFYLL